jgi:class 3 adenylate cyclase
MLLGDEATHFGCSALGVGRAQLGHDGRRLSSLRRRHRRPLWRFVAKYMGDSVLAYFGYPEAHEDDAERAARAGLAVIATRSADSPHPSR